MRQDPEGPSFIEASALLMTIIRKFKKLLIVTIQSEIMGSGKQLLQQIKSDKKIILMVCYESLVENLNNATSWQQKRRLSMKCWSVV